MKYISCRSYDVIVLMQLMFGPRHLEIRILLNRHVMVEE